MSWQVQSGIAGSGDWSMESSLPDNATPSTQAKTQGNTERKDRNWESDNYAPEFYDRLPRIHLTVLALKELNRRTRRYRRSYTPPPPRQRHGALSCLESSAAEARFARHGGPDLTDLRGYPHQPTGHPQPPVMRASRSSRSRRTRADDPASSLTTPTSETTTNEKKKRACPRDLNFAEHLTQHTVHELTPEQPDLEEVNAAVSRRRPSLSSSTFSEGAFRAFRENDLQAKNEADVMLKVIPTILGRGESRRHSAVNTTMNALKPLTDGTITAAKPDIYWGAPPGQLTPSVSKNLSGHIMPSTTHNMPMAPNVFMEVKGPRGTTGVAIQQVRYDGALGARAMHSLQNCFAEEPSYDNTPHTFSFTYHNGTLTKYSHHVTAPTTEGGQPEYHMSHVDSFAMNGNRRGFIAGAADFRNTLDLANSYRQRFIANANAGAPQAQTTPGGLQSRDQQATNKVLHDEDPAVEGTIPGLPTEAQRRTEATEATSPSPTRSRESGCSPDPSSIDPSASTSTTRPAQRLSKRKHGHCSGVAEEGRPSKARSRRTSRQ